jgi:hypothetical protein
LSSVEAVQADVVFKADTGTASREIEEFRQQVVGAYSGYSTEALKAQAATDKFDRALGRAGNNAQKQRAAVVAYRRDLASLETQTRQNSAEIGVLTTKTSGLEREVGRLGRGALAGSGVLHGLGRAAAFASTSFLGGAGLVYALRTVIKAGQEQSQVLANLRNAVTASGNSWGGYQAQITAVTEETKRLSAFDDDDLYKSLTVLVRATGDVTKSLELNRKASEIARGTNKDLSVVATAVAKAYEGQEGQLRRLVPAIDANVGGQKAIEEAYDRNKGAAEAYTKTAAGAQESLTVAIGDTEKAIGRGLTPTVKDLETRLADWLNDSKNQKRIQDDLNTAVKDGTAIVHGLSDAEKTLSGPISGVIDALGGLEHAVEVAFVVGLAAKARKGATAVDGILTASGLVRNQMVADAATEETALAGVQAQAERTAAAVAAIGTASGTAAAESAAVGATGAAAGAARSGVTAAAAGSFIGGALSKGGRLLMRGGEVYLIYKGLEYALGSSPPTSASGPNRYQGADLVQDWKNFASDAIHHPGSFVKNLGEGLLNDFGLTNYKSTGLSGTKIAPPLQWQDLYPAIQAGALTISGINALHAAGRIPDKATYLGAIALANQVSAANVGPTAADAAGRGAAPPTVTGAALLTPLARAKAAVQSAAITPGSGDDLKALSDEAALLRKNVTVERGRLEHATSAKQAAKFNANLQGLEGDLEGVLGQIDQINQDAAAQQAKKTREAAARVKKDAAEAKAAREKAARDRAKALRDSIAVQLQPLQDSASHALTGEKQSATAAIAGELAHGQPIPKVTNAAEPAAVKALIDRYRKLATDPRLTGKEQARYAHLANQEQAKWETVLDGLRKQRTAALKKAATAEASETKKQKAIIDQRLQNRLSAADLLETEAGTNATKLRKAYEAELAAEEAILAEQQKRDKKLTGLAKEQGIGTETTISQSIAAIKQQLAPAAPTGNALLDQQLQNRLAVAQLHETQAGDNAAKTRKAIREEIADYQAILAQQESEMKGLSGVAKAQSVGQKIATEQAIAGLKNDLAQQSPAATAAANEAQFLTSARDIVQSYDPNFSTVTGLLKQTNSHLFNVAHDTRKQTHAVKDATDRAKFAGTWSNLSWVDGAYA